MGSRSPNSLSISPEDDTPIKVELDDDNDSLYKERHHENEKSFRMSERSAFDKIQPNGKTFSRELFHESGISQQPQFPYPYPALGIPKELATRYPSILLSEVAHAQGMPMHNAKERLDADFALRFKDLRYPLVGAPLFYHPERLPFSHYYMNLSKHPAESQFGNKGSGPVFPDLNRISREREDQREVEAKNRTFDERMNGEIRNGSNALDSRGENSSPNSGDHSAFSSPTSSVTSPGDLSTSLPLLNIPQYGNGPLISNAVPMSGLNSPNSYQTSAPMGVNGNSGIIHPAFLGLGLGIGRTRDPSKPPPVKKYKCDVCGKAFSRSNTLVTHKVSTFC